MVRPQMVWPQRALTVLTAIALLEGVALVVYALLAIINAVLGGSFGPEEISNTPAITLEIVIFAVLGAGLVITGIGWWRSRRWARAPFVLMQLIALVVGYPLIAATGMVERVAGIALVLFAVIGLLLTFLPSTTRALIEAD